MKLITSQLINHNQLTKEINGQYTADRTFVVVFSPLIRKLRPIFPNFHNGGHNAQLVYMF